MVTTRQDFLHRYANTWVKLLGSSTPYYVPDDQYYDEDEDYPIKLIPWSVEDFEDYDEWVFDPDEIIEYPPLGYINFKGESPFFMRSPERQWRRGFTFDNIHVSEVRLTDPSFETSWIANPLIPLIFAPQYETVERAIQLVEDETTGHVSVAIAPDFTVQKHHYIDYYPTHLAYNTNVVGYFDEGILHLPRKLDFLGEYINYPLKIEEGY